MRPTLDLFGLSIAAYSLLLVAGLYLAIGLFVLLAGKRGMPRPIAFLIAVVSVVAGLIGARVLFVITQLPLVLQAIRQGEWQFVGRLFVEGGQVFFGGLIGGFLVAWLMAKRLKASFGVLADAALPAVAFGQAIGRIGCHFAGCCHGVPVDACGVVFPAESLAPPDVMLFPTQLTEAGFLFVLSAVLVWLCLKKRNGFVAPVYLVAYGAFRFAIEFVRGDDIRGFLGPLSTSQWIALGLLLSGLWLIFMRRRLVAGPNDG